MATIRESLEASLQEQWDRATLEVYGDHLLSLGDPRGELIALDREIRSSGLTRALVDRKGEVLRAWLGVDARSSHLWDPAWFRDGFVELSIGGEDVQAQGLLRDLLPSPAGPYLRTLRLSASSAGISRALESLSSGHRPWLQRLELRPQDPGSIVVSRPGAFADATPRLQTLGLPSRHLESFAHAGLRRLELCGPFPERYEPDLQLPNVVEIGLHLRADDDLVTLKSLLRPETFPALRRLDLSNDRGTARSPVGIACDLAASVDAHSHLTHLRMPSLRTDADAERARALLASMPDLVELSFGRRYACADAHHARIEHPALAPLPPPRPWPPEDEQWRRAAFSIVFDHFCQRVELSWNNCLSILEERFEDLAEPIRGAWHRLWPAFAEAAADGDRVRGIRCSKQLFARALQALLDERGTGRFWPLKEGIEIFETPVEVRWNGPVAGADGPRPINVRPNEPAGGGPLADDLDWAGFVFGGF